jgi:hypothetical protein
MGRRRDLHEICAAMTAGQLWPVETPKMTLDQVVALHDPGLPADCPAAWQHYADSPAGGLSCDREPRQPIERRLVLNPGRGASDS